MVGYTCLRIAHSTTTITGVQCVQCSYQREGAAQPQYKRLHFDLKVQAVMLTMTNKYYAFDIRLCTAVSC
jgi:hypothetical protein